VGHLIDVERLFEFRALAMARQDDVDLLAAAPEIARPMGKRLKRIHESTARGRKEVVQDIQEDARAALRALPDGEAEFTDIFDGDGVIGVAPRFVTSCFTVAS